MSRFKLALLLAGAVSVSACNNSTTNIPTQPSQPNYVTDSFDGSINRNGAATHPFSVSSAGVITATIQTVSDSSKRIGLSLGTWNGTACAIIIANDQAAEGTTVTGQATAFGTLCVRVYDVGNVVDPLAYTLRVIHP